MKLYLFFAVFFVPFSSIVAFNITQILEKYPDFSSFNNFLSQAKLSSQINARQTITVLAVANGAAGQLSGMSPDMMKGILSLHVVLDYYDIPKLQKLSKKTAILTSLFQSSGLARGQQGFLNVTVESGGKVAFGSAVAGAPLGAELMKSIESEPYNVSVLQVSSLIIPPGFDGSPTNSTSSPPPPPATSPGSAPNATQSPTPSASSPAEADAPQAAEVPSSDSPPSADSPSSSPGSAPTGTPPAADSTPADAPEARAPANDGPSSGSAILRVGFTMALTAALASLLAF